MYFVMDVDPLFITKTNSKNSKTSKMFSNSLFKENYMIQYITFLSIRLRLLNFSSISYFYSDSVNNYMLNLHFSFSFKVQYKIVFLFKYNIKQISVSKRFGTEKVFISIDVIAKKDVKTETCDNIFYSVFFRKNATRLVLNNFLR